MPQSPNKVGLQQGLLRTKISDEGGLPSRPWQQFFTSLVTTQANSPQAYSLTNAQRLKLTTSSINIGSTAFETDTGHVFLWNGKAWVQIV
jgi:hypothetical protein